MTEPPAARGAPVHSRRLLSPIWFLALPLLGYGVWGEYRAWQQERAIRAIPAVERRTIYQRALADHRALCAPFVHPALRERCSADADFLSRFPECDGDCKTLVAAQHARPAR